MLSPRVGPAAEAAVKKPPAVIKKAAEAVAGAPAPAPAGERPADAELSFYEPLSIDDVIILARRADVLLARAPDQYTDLRRKAARRMIDSSISYSKFLDDRHSHLGSYRWFRVAEQMAPASGIDADRVALPAPVERVSAISFSADNADIFIWHIRVVNDEGAQTTFQVNKWINEGLPRTYICYLREPTRVVAVETRRQARGARGRLTLYAGVTREMEHAKNAIYLMQSALDAVEESRDAEAVKSLREARKSLERFKKSIESGPVNRKRGWWPW